MIQGVWKSKYTLATTMYYSANIKQQELKLANQSKHNIILKLSYRLTRRFLTWKTQIGKPWKNCIMISSQLQ